MSQVYTIEFENQTFTNAGGDRDLFYIAPADDRGVRILGLFLSQTSDLGDAEEEIIRLRVIRGHTTVGSGGASATPQLVDPRSSAAGMTARTNDTTIASAGTAVNLHSDGWNIRAPYALILPDDMQWQCDQGQTTIVVRAMAGPTDDLTGFSGTLYVKEG